MQVNFSLTLPETTAVNSGDVKRITVYALFERGILSSGQASTLLGLSKRAFLENAFMYDVSIFQYDADELADDLDQWQ